MLLIIQCRATEAIFMREMDLLNSKILNFDRDVTVKFENGGRKLGGQLNRPWFFHEYDSSLIEV